MLETVADENACDPAFNLQNADLASKLDAMISTLSQKHAEVLARRFGLRGYEPGTLEEVGKEIGVTRERVRQIQMEALSRLRQNLEAEGLNPSAIFG